MFKKEKLVREINSLYKTVKQSHKMQNCDSLFHILYWVNLQEHLTRLWGTLHEFQVSYQIRWSTKHVTSYC